MTTFSAQVAASSDDADQAAGTVDLTASTMNANSASQYIGLRFLNVTIPNAATINSASISLNFTSASYDDPDVTIYAEATDDSTTFTTGSSNISGRTSTSATVTWTATGIGTGTKTSPDIKTVIQEIVNRGGWTSGNDINIIIKGNGGSSAFRIRSYDAGSDYPQINIDYTAGGGSTQPSRTMHQFRMRTA